jgi:hypothetical protein
MNRQLLCTFERAQRRTAAEDGRSALECVLEPVLRSDRV